MEDSNPRKRPRPVVSCLRCRDKKLKCDRTSPCENCVKASIADTCTYKRDGLGTPAKIAAREASPATSRPRINSPMLLSSTPCTPFDDLQMRMAKVEEILGVRPGSTRPDQDTVALAKQQPTTPAALLGTLVVKGSRSVYHGQNDRVTLLNQFLDVKDFFLNEMSENEQLQASAKQVKFLQQKSHEKISSPDVVESDFSISLLKLHESLPPKVYCDRLVTIYCRHFERTMRVLHLPTFMRQYEQIWTNTNPDIWSSSSIIPQVTAVMTMAYHMDDSIPSSDDEAHRAYLKGAAIDLIQAWLDELSRKQRTELATLQVDILLLLSRSLRQMHPEKLWVATGALTRSAIAMGLHMNPTSVPKITPYQVEMRRRLWQTVLEMDLQASMTTGMPLVVPEFEFGNLLPANIDDSDFDESSVQLPASRPLDVYTDNSYQVYLATSLPKRLEALSLVQRSCPDMDDAVRVGRLVEDCISRKPAVLDLHNSGFIPTDSGSLLHRVLLDLYLRRPLLCLYKPLLLRISANQTLSSEIQKHCLESSLAILSYQYLYSTQALGTITGNPQPQQDFFYRCCKTDMLWAALSVCQHIKTLRQAVTTNKHLETHTGQDKASLVKIVENTIDCLVSRIGRKGGDLKDIVFLSLALQSVQLPESFPDRRNALIESTKNALSACRESLMRSIMTVNETSSTPTVKRAKIAKPAYSSISPPESILTPTSMSDLPILMDFQENSEQWFGNLSNVATELNNGQGTWLNSGDAFNFGINQDWNWEHMWQ